MSNELLRRFAREIKKDSSLYKFYLEHPSIIMDEFQKFLKLQEKNNEYFANIVKKHHFVKGKDAIIETKISEDIKGISDFLNNNEKTEIICSYGVVKTPHPLELSLTSESCYITNGIYEHTNEIYKQIVYYIYANKPSFIIGAVDRINYEKTDDSLHKINSVFFEENKKRIKLIQNELHKRHIPISVYSENNKKHNVYMLIHRGDRKWSS